MVSGLPSLVLDYWSVDVVVYRDFLRISGQQRYRNSGILCFGAGSMYVKHFRTRFRRAGVKAVRRAPGKVKLGMQIKDLF